MFQISLMISIFIVAYLIILEMRRKEIGDDNIIDIGEDGKMKKDDIKKEKIYSYLKLIPIIFIAMVLIIFSIKISIILLPIILVLSLIRRR